MSALDAALCSVTNGLLHVKPERGEPSRDLRSTSSVPVPKVDDSRRKTEVWVWFAPLCRSERKRERDSNLRLDSLSRQRLSLLSKNSVPVSERRPAATSAIFSSSPPTHAPHRRPPRRPLQGNPTKAHVFSSSQPKKKGVAAPKLEIDEVQRKNLSPSASRVTMDARDGNFTVMDLCQKLIVSNCKNGIRKKNPMALSAENFAP